MENETGEHTSRSSVDRIVDKYPETESGITYSADEIKGKPALSIIPPGMKGKGIVITSRTLEEIDKYFLSGVKKALHETKGKVIFLGNGLSDAPLVVAERYKQGKAYAPPVVVDVFDYQKINQDLLSIYEDFSTEGIDPEIYVEQPLSRAVKSSTRLVEAIKDGSLVALQLELPSESLPESMHGADIIVNCFGPKTHNQSDMDQQLSLLANGGKLFTTEGRDLQANGLQRKMDGYTSIITNKQPPRFNINNFLHRR